MSEKVNYETSHLYISVASLRLIKTAKILTLSAAFFYTGLELSFFSGVYGSCLGFTKRFGSDSSKFLGINGLLIGAGEITGGLLFSILGKQTNKAGRDPIVLIGYLTHVVAFYTIFVNLPANSPLGPTWEPAYIESKCVVSAVDQCPLHVVHWRRLLSELIFSSVSAI
ncbi:hypothetical protein HPB48_022496 [Haemaphysalis longicornis]|uniref:Uncharacterized protein n=1 Tax=Haemaphysalis longicornis TaxID=44386 RepID=A0A9J6FQE3_HAELO|nr:hypothetical protein HPB48_022496 [Haemaphysalis longicornis]